MNEESVDGSTSSRNTDDNDNSTSSGSLQESRPSSPSQGAEENMVVDADDDVIMIDTSEDGEDTHKAKKTSRRKRKRNRNLTQESEPESSQIQTTNNESRSKTTVTAQCEHKPISNGTAHATTSGKKSNKGAKKSKPAVANYDINKPEKIVEFVLSRGRFKTPDLSGLIKEKFEASDYKEVLKRELHGITYADTVGPTEIDMSVLPTLFQNARVCMPPHAIINLTEVGPSITKRPRWRDRRKNKASVANKVPPKNPSSDKKKENDTVFKNMGHFNQQTSSNQRQGRTERLDKQSESSRQESGTSTSDNNNKSSRSKRRARRDRFFREQARQ